MIRPLPTVLLTVLPWFEVAEAQSFNLDVGEPTNVPSSSYGAAALQAGVWNTASEATNYATSIVDTLGTPTPITTSVVGGNGDFFSDNILTSGGDNDLLDDVQNAGQVMSTWTFAGLVDGPYEVYTYAWAPDSTGFVSSVAPAGHSPQSVGGTFPGMHVQGVTFAKHSVIVSGGTIDIDVMPAVNFGTVNGFQFVFGGNDPVESCHGDGGDQMGCTSCPCSNDAPPGTFGGCLNSTAMSARLLRSGSGSVIAGDLRFEMSGGVPGFAVLTSGASLAPTNMSNPCFGLDSGIQSVNLDGLRCVVQDVFRHGSRSIDLNGDVGSTTSGWGPPDAPVGGLGAQAAAMSGDVRHFQAVYREMAGSVCLTEQNTSQAVTVTFTP